MLTRRDALASLAAGASALSAGAGTARSTLLYPTASGLANLARRTGRLYGCATSTFELATEGFPQVLRHEAGILVPEYEMKRRTMEPRPGEIDFAAADALLHFANGNGMRLRGHTLIWHKANPAWLESQLGSSPRQALFTGYIDKVIRRYVGRLHSWDVVNEALDPESGRPDNLRETVWLKAFGAGYIADAFHAARAADPGASLVYNDWGCEGAGPKHDRFRAATLDFLEKALARGIPIDAYGMQGHLQAFGPPVDQPKLREFLDRVKSLGLRVLVTEHDVDDSGGTYDVVLRDRAVADASRRFLDVVLDCPATDAVLTWGLSDRFLDPPGWKARLEGYSPRFLPLDTRFVRKPLWGAMAAAFAEAPQGSSGTKAARAGSLRLHKFANP